MIRFVRARERPPDLHRRRRTDEDAFRAIEQRGVGIVVGEQSHRTAASYSLKDPAEVERFLRALIATLT